jgi:Raf kinase inhibitor-like YbhB/YbcL family protein
MPGTRIRRSTPLKKPVSLAVTSPAFQDGQRIPDRYARGGVNVSPALHWSQLPVDTVSIALICEDPDAPQPDPFTHWVIFNIPPTVEGVPEGVSRVPQPGEVWGAAQGVNDFDDIGYDGPAPPHGHGLHRYRFQIHALDAMLNLPPGVSKMAVRQAMEGHILGKGVLSGTYSR